MFVRKMSGGLEFPEDQSPLSPDELERLYASHEAAFTAAHTDYLAYLATRDFSKVGDLLPYFVKDFFHDSPLDDFKIDGFARTVSFRATAYVERGDAHSDVEFDVVFRDVVWLDWALAEPGGNLYDYRYSEIDGLGDRIVEANERFAGEFHSLTIETGWGGWICLVFTSVTVAPVDVTDWLALLRDPSVQLPALYTGETETPGSEAASAPA